MFDAGSDSPSLFKTISGYFAGAKARSAGLEVNAPNFLWPLTDPEWVPYSGVGV
jgi:hypothetical protein